MSNDKGGEKPPNTPFRVVRSNETVKISESQAKQLYMASSCVEWTPFAKTQKWNATESRKLYPVKDWIQEKRDILAREQAENIAEMVFSHRSKWHMDVLKTLNEYPDTHDTVHSILRHRINQIVDVIKTDDKNQVEAAVKNQPYASEFAKISTSELCSIVSGLKTLTDSRHRSLLINDWSVKVAEQFTDPKQFEVEHNRVMGTDWKVEVIGGGNMTPKMLQEFVAGWYDKPQFLHEPKELEPPTPSEEPEGEVEE